MSINNGTMNRIGAGGTLNTFGSVQSVDNTKIQELTEAIDSATEAIQEAVQDVSDEVESAKQEISVTAATAVQDIDNEVSNAKQEISDAATTVVQYDVPVICPKEDVGSVLIKNAELGDTETIEVLRPTGAPVTTPIRIGTSLDTCSLINVGAVLAHWKTYGATEIKFGYQADDYCYRDEVGDVFSRVSAVLGTIDRAQPVQDTFEYPTGVTGTDYVCKITPTSVESFNKSETNQVFTIAVTDENIATYSDVWFGVYTYGLTIGSASWFHDYAAKYGTVWVTTADGEVVSYTGKTIDFSQFVNVGEFSELNSKVPFKFAIDSNGNYGYIKDGADTVTPFKSGGGDSMHFINGNCYKGICNKVYRVRIILPYNYSGQYPLKAMGTRVRVGSNYRYINAPITFHDYTEGDIPWEDDFGSFEYTDIYVPGFDKSDAPQPTIYVIQFKELGNQSYQEKLNVLYTLPSVMYLPGYFTIGANNISSGSVIKVKQEEATLAESSIFSVPANDSLTIEVPSLKNVWVFSDDYYVAGGLINIREGNLVVNLLGICTSNDPDTTVSLVTCTAMTPTSITLTNTSSTDIICYAVYQTD